MSEQTTPPVPRTGIDGILSGIKELLPAVAFSVALPLMVFVTMPASNETGLGAVRFPHRSGVAVTGQVAAIAKNDAGAIRGAAVDVGLVVFDAAWQIILPVFWLWSGTADSLTPSSAPATGRARRGPSSSRPPIVILTNRHIVGYQVQHFLPDEQATNQVVVSYTDPASAFNKAEAEYVQDDDDIAARGQVRSQNLDARSGRSPVPRAVGRSTRRTRRRSPA